MIQLVVTEAFDEFFADVTAALPRILAGIAFLIVAAVVVRSILAIVRYFVARLLPDESPVYHRFVVTVVGLFLWFGVALAFLSIVGLTLVAASLGTATGFLALGVSFALSGMIEDAVAGVYLLQDPDFQAGDTITVGDVTGDVVAIELRKTRLLVDGDTVVRANADIEKQWRKRGQPAE